MAFGLFSPTYFSSSTRLPPRSRLSLGTTSGTSRCTNFVHCMAITEPKINGLSYKQPPIWDYTYLQSLTNNYVGKTYTRRADRLKEDVRMMLGKLDRSLFKLELIDTLQRLGISYHFQVEIKRILENIYKHNNEKDIRNSEELYATALEFRLLRQHGYGVPQDVFNNFRDEYGNFNTCLTEDTKGLLSLYEASYLSTSGESILDEARNFTTKHLKQNLQRKIIDEDLVILVKHAFELPLHLRMLRLEARWFIDVYERSHDINTTLLEFAKLDFNLVQATHQEDLKYMSRWWKGTCLGDKLSFARDNLVENFFWSVGVIFEPRFRTCRRMVTELASLITIVDDVYDVYGTLEELELFTNFVERWDINAIEQLPGYLQLCFQALHNSVNKIADVTLKEGDSYIISYLKNAWADLCKSYLVEAKWYNNKYTPTLEEYIKNAWISVGGPLVLVHAYFMVADPITQEGLESLVKMSNITQWSSMIIRLSNDLGTSQGELKSGDNAKSIQCYMHETGCSDEDAREHIKYLISETWKKVNEERVLNSPLNKIFMHIAMNLARMGLCIYQHGDGHGIEEVGINRIMSLFMNPIPLV